MGEGEVTYSIPLPTSLCLRMSLERRASLAKEQGGVETQHVLSTADMEGLFATVGGSGGWRGGGGGGSLGVYRWWLMWRVPLFAQRS